MMQAIDTHELYKELVYVGLTDKQADIVVKKFATKDEVKDVENRVATKADISEIRKDFEVGLTKHRKDFEVGLAKLETSLIKWNLGFLIGIAGLFLAYLRYVH
jgi:hypothetical protein